MLPYVRVYASEDAAKEIAARLAQAGLDNQRTYLAGSLKGQEDSALRAAAEEGFLPGSHIAICTGILKQGRSLVSVKAPFGQGELAIEIMQGDGDTLGEALPEPVVRNPSPLSDALGLPVLSDPTSMTELKESSWSLSGLLGLGLLGGGAAPLSSLFGMKTLTAQKRPWTSSFGMSLLSRNPAPLSSMLGMKTLTAQKRPWNTSWGFRMLSRNPTPLSSMFGMRVLSKDD